MDLTRSPRLAMAEATARRWFRRLEALSVTDAGDQHFSCVHRQRMGAERAVIVTRQSFGAPPAASPDGAPTSPRLGPSGDH